MKSKLSAVLDDEATGEEIAVLCGALCHRKDLQDDAATYALIGNCLRGESAAFVNLTPQVMAAIEQEAIVLAPANLNKRPYSSSKGAGWALAASIVGLLVVSAGLFIPKQETSDSKFVFASAPLGTTLSPTSRQHIVERVPSLRETDIREYLIAHQAHSRGAYLGADSQQIRTVSLLDESAK